MLVKHLRGEGNVPFGTIVALDRNKIGFALCNPKDQFSKSMGTLIASGRAKDNHSLPDSLHYRYDIVLDEVEAMEDRARRYFKPEED